MVCASIYLKPPPPQLTNFRKPWPPLIRPPGLKTRDSLPVLEYEEDFCTITSGSQIEVSKDRPVYKSNKGRYSIYPVGLLTMPPIPIRLHLQSATGVSSGAWPIWCQLKRNTRGVTCQKGLRSREKLLWFPAESPSTPLLAWKEQTWTGSSPRGLAWKLHAVSTVTTSGLPCRHLHPSRNFQGQSSLQGILWIKNKNVIIKKTILQLRSPLLEAPPARKALGSVSWVHDALLGGRQWDSEIPAWQALAASPSLSPSFSSLSWSWS